LATFNDPDATADKRFPGVVIFDFDETVGELSTPEIVRHAWDLGLNPGGMVLVRKVHDIPDEHKNNLITDDELLLSLGSRGRSLNHQC
jgi:hypothetical protein